MIKKLVVHLAIYTCMMHIYIMVLSEKFSEN